MECSTKPWTGSQRHLWRESRASSESCVELAALCLGFWEFLCLFFFFFAFIGQKMVAELSTTWFLCIKKCMVGNIKLRVLFYWTNKDSLAWKRLKCAEWVSWEEYSWELDAIWNVDVFGFLPALLRFQESNLLKGTPGFLLYNVLDIYVA